MLDHPNIIRAHEVYKTKSGKLCIVMDYADGGDLSAMIKKREANNMEYFSEEDVFNILCQICLALKVCHEHKILHRDLKPHNILLMKNGRVKLADFGIAKILNTRSVATT